MLFCGAVFVAMGTQKSLSVHIYVQVYYAWKEFSVKEISITLKFMKMDFFSPPRWFDLTCTHSVAEQKGMLTFQTLVRENSFTYVTGFGKIHLIAGWVKIDFFKKRHLLSLIIPCTKYEGADISPPCHEGTTLSPLWGARGSWNSLYPQPASSWEWVWSF